MYAIVTNGSRQHRVEAGSKVNIDYRDVKVGDTVELDDVLLLQNGAETLIGQPRLLGAKVITEVIGFPKTKTMTQKFRRRKNSRRLKGHTQPFVQVQVKHILKSGESAPSA